MHHLLLLFTPSPAFSAGGGDYPQTHPAQTGLVGGIQASLRLSPRGSGKIAELKLGGEGKESIRNIRIQTRDESGQLPPHPHNPAPAGCSPRATAVPAGAPPIWPIARSCPAPDSCRRPSGPDGFAGGALSGHTACRISRQSAWGDTMASERLAWQRHKVQRAAPRMTPGACEYNRGRRSGWYHSPPFGCRIVCKSTGCSSACPCGFIADRAQRGRYRLRRRRVVFAVGAHGSECTDRFPSSVPGKIHQTS
jgi:hypothetical protein